jgi:hypothetical protein
MSDLKVRPPKRRLPRDRSAITVIPSEARNLLFADIDHTIEG